MKSRCVAARRAIFIVSVRCRADTLEVRALVPGAVGIRRSRVRLRRAHRHALAVEVGDEEECGRAQHQVVWHGTRLRAIPGRDRRDAAVLLTELADGDATGRVTGKADAPAVELGPGRVHVTSRRGSTGSGEEVVQRRLRVVVVRAAAGVVGSRDLEGQHHVTGLRETLGRPQVHLLLGGAPVDDHDARVARLVRAEAGRAVMTRAVARPEQQPGQPVSRAVVERHLLIAKALAVRAPRIAERILHVRLPRVGQVLGLRRRERGVGRRVPEALLAAVDVVLLALLPLGCVRLRVSGGALAVDALRAGARGGERQRAEREQQRRRSPHYPSGEFATSRYE